MSTGAHLLLGLLSIGSIIFILRLVSRQVLKAKYALLWLTIGAILAVMAAVPQLLDAVADQLGVAYQPAVWIMLALAFLLILSIHFSWELSRLETKVRTLAEEVALLRQRVDDPEKSAS